MSDTTNPASTTTDGTPGGTTSTASEGFKPITSQDDLNKVIAGRIDRVKSQYSDYDDLKAKAARFDELEQANKSELEKAQERALLLEKERDTERATALRLRIAAKNGISDEDADLFLTGTTEDQLTKQAQRLTERAADRARNSNRVPGEGRTPNPPKLDDERDAVRQLFGSG